ncbi:hypothetical protein HPP92_013037 [Vanilla planifolia]|uniref:Uncharacterized protein n=1 Tax=Vanilla planifolia TaxID=51239 RepID=A0A835QMN3_VANPL|nr:hypothetical protein HPP92_013037 [Vanilla planifolia]
MLSYITDNHFHQEEGSFSSTRSGEREKRPATIAHQRKSTHRGRYARGKPSPLRGCTSRGAWWRSGGGCKTWRGARAPGRRSGERSLRGGQHSSPGPLRGGQKLSTLFKASECRGAI